MIRAAIEFNRRISRWIDDIFPASLSIDGNSDYRANFAWDYLRAGQIIYDIGGGKQPFITFDQKLQYDFKITGVDISEAELGLAPRGIYCREIAHDICSFKGDGDADIVVCQALLEHVPDVGSAIRSISSALKPGGTCLLFVPCRNAPFARLNLLLPESWKRWLLHTIFPSTKKAQGFPSFYDRCTPSSMRNLAELSGLVVVELRRYYISTYFSFFFPLYLVHRIWMWLVWSFGGGDFCETFVMALKKS